jgi:CRISPR system Cascade subunit CasE
MTHLHLLSFAINRAKLLSLAASRGTIPPSGDLGYAFHQVLNETFGAAAPKPFHFFPDPFGLAVAYSQYDAAALHDFAFRRREAVPSWDVASQALGLASLRASPLPKNWTEGMRFRFSVRTRPVCRINGHHERKLPRECDVFRRAVAAKADESGWLDRRDVYLRWFAGQIPAAAASLVSLQLSKRTHTQVYRRGAPCLNGPDASFSGILQITSPAAFRDFLARGAGRHRAFGFGMILLGGLHSQEAPSLEGIDRNNYLRI